jgi:MFS family permease
MVSATNVVGSQVSAHLSDKFGRKTTIVPGLASIALAVSGIPYAQDGSHLTALMFLWGVGGASVSAGPTAFVADLVEEKDRAQALAMLRSCGDLGLLIGAGATGALAFSTSMETAFLANSALLAAATANVALRAEEKSGGGA